MGRSRLRASCRLAEGQRQWGVGVGGVWGGQQSLLRDVVVLERAGPWSGGVRAGADRQAV